MKISEALKIIQGAPEEGNPFPIAVACGFTPLHLETFLCAHLQLALPGRKVTSLTGLYGDLANTIEGFAGQQIRNLVVAIEWGDLDPRLSCRASARWNQNTISDVLNSVRSALARLGKSFGLFPAGAKVVVSMPTLPLPPFFHTPSWQISEPESCLDQMVSDFRTQLLRSGLLVANPACLIEKFAPEERYSFKSDLLLGLPYSVTFSDALASVLARLLCPVSPKKGIITDLDDTLWSGLVGEVGAEGISWDVPNHSGLHGLYQSLLASLSSSGILVGVASKNDSEIVNKAFERSDILLQKEYVFPIETHWGPKSQSVSRILRAWNVGADSVIFVDDNPMELAEVAAAHPGVECVQFVQNDYPAGYAMLGRIRDLCGKQKLSSEDYIRLESIRQSASLDRTGDDSTPEQFLQQANAVVRFDNHNAAADSRALELVNKTNQFNLNGIRYTESDWSAELSRLDTQSLLVSYSDRFGLLGKIAVMMGRMDGNTFHVRVWVMSCRAFSRRIEYLCLKTCFERYRIDQIKMDFVATPKNGPFQEFLTHVLGGKPEGPTVITRERFENVCPELYHAVHDGENRAPLPAMTRA